MIIKDGEPDGMGGIAAVVLCSILLVVLILVPWRKGASPGGKFYLAGLALIGVSWGVRQIRAARAQDKRDPDHITSTIIAPPLRKLRRRRWIGLGLGLLVGLCLFGPYIFEPTAQPILEDVNVVSYRTGARGSQYFMVTSTRSGKSWEVGAASGPFSPDYRGPAILEIRRGRWTGQGHFRLLTRNGSVSGLTTQ